MRLYSAVVQDRYRGSGRAIQVHEGVMCHECDGVGGGAYRCTVTLRRPNGGVSSCLRRWRCSREEYREYSEAQRRGVRVRSSKAQLPAAAVVFLSASMCCLLSSPQRLQRVVTAVIVVRIFFNPGGAGDASDAENTSPEQAGEGGSVRGCNTARQ